MIGGGGKRIVLQITARFGNKRRKDDLSWAGMEPRMLSNMRTYTHSGGQREKKNIRVVRGPPRCSSPWAVGAWAVGHPGSFTNLLGTPQAGRWGKPFFLSPSRKWGLLLATAGPAGLL